MLTYTLWYGTSADNITTQGKSSVPTKQGETVRIEQNDGLSNDTMYYFKVVVTDGTDEITSDKCNESTYCKGEYCEGGYYTYPDCPNCVNGKVVCTSNGCVGGYINCSGTFVRPAATARPPHLGFAICPTCRSEQSSYYGSNWYTCLTCGGWTCCWVCNDCSANYYMIWQTSRWVCQSDFVMKHLAEQTTCNECSGTGYVKCSKCKGDGNIPQLNNCTHGFSISVSHYYCSSSKNTNHGNNIAQYHK